ncbi:MAG: AI-2E family transporter [Hyphomicrobiales bacterium]|nr:AI-2E family transporter [Hyphomicrobiales bacterium]
MENGREVRGRGVVDGAVIFIASCAALAILIYGADFLIPIVIAFLIVGLISSTVDRLIAAGLAPWLAMLCAIAVMVAAVLVFILILYYQTQAISEAWPRYAERLNGIAASLSARLGSDVFASLMELASKADFTGIASGFADTAGATLGAIALVLMYAAFLLAERGRMPEKFGFLVPDAEKSAKYLEVFNRVNQGTRSYLWIKTIMSLMTSGLCYVILRMYSVDFAEFWGLLIFFLNFIPSIGSIIGVILPSVLTLLQFDTVWVFVQVAVLMSCVQFVIGNIVEPRYMGKTLNLSPFVVIVALTFWGTIWGIEGMFLSVPFTASLVIVCGNIPNLRWIAILFSSDGRLDLANEPGGDDRTIRTESPRHSIFKRSATKTAEIEDLRRELEEIKKTQSSRKT